MINIFFDFYLFYFILFFFFFHFISYFHTTSYPIISIPPHFSFPFSLLSPPSLSLSLSPQSILQTSTSLPAHVTNLPSSLSPQSILQTFTSPPSPLCPLLLREKEREGGWNSRECGIYLGRRRIKKMLCHSLPPQNTRLHSLIIVHPKH